MANLSCRTILWLALLLTTGAHGKITDISYEETDTYLTVHWKWEGKSSLSGLKFEVSIIPKICPQKVLKKISQGNGPLAVKLDKVSIDVGSMDFDILIKPLGDQFQQMDSRLHVRKCPSNKVKLDREQHMNGFYQVYVEWKPFACDGQYEIEIEMDGHRKKKLLWKKSFGQRVTCWFDILPDVRQYTVNVCNSGHPRKECIEKLTVPRKAKTFSLEVEDTAASASWSPSLPFGVDKQSFYAYLNETNLGIISCERQTLCNHLYKDLVPLTPYSVRLSPTDAGSHTPEFFFQTTGDAKVKDTLFFAARNKFYLAFMSQYKKSFDKELLYKVSCYVSAQCEKHQRECSKEEKTDVLWPGPGKMMAVETSEPSSLQNCTVQLFNPSTGLSGQPQLLHYNSALESEP